MERPGTSLLASIAVHAAVVLAVVGYGLLGFTREPLNVESAVPVSIISDTVIEAAAPDNPDDEPVTEEAATAPVVPTPSMPVPPEPVPPTPAPVPVKKATPARPVLPRTTPPPRPQPPRPTPPRREETLDLDSLAGPPRPGPRPGPRPPTGQQGQGTAPRAIGRASLQALASQVTPYWNVSCDLPGSDDLTIGVRVTLDQRGAIVGSPRLTQSRGDPVWRAAADGVLRAMRAAAPFEMPADYQQQEIAFSFRTATMCGSR
ncbi:MAG: hypothetical protein ACK5RN_14585 [bacterium]